MASRRRKEELDPELFQRLVAAVKKNPSLVDAADECGVHPRTLALWVKRGLFPNAERQFAALATTLRGSRARIRGDLFVVLADAALGRGKTAGGESRQPDPKWAAYLLERLTEEEPVSWAATVPGPADKETTLEHVMRNPPAEVLAAIAAAGKKLVPLEPGDAPALPPASVAEGELEDEPE